MTQQECRDSAVVPNERGLHLRAAGRLVALAERFGATIWIETHAMRANAKSIMSVLSLAATNGTNLNIIAVGDDA